MKRTTMLFGIIFLGSICSGCSIQQVEPWQKEILARKDMQLGSNELVDALDDHIYFSKEATSGGRSFAGGGCGCN